MLLHLKTYIKDNFGGMYEKIRSVSLPIYLRLRALSLLRFKEKMLCDFSYNGVDFKIYLDPKNGFIDREIFWKGVYEEGFLDFLKKEIKSDDVYLDIGANIGQHALFVSRLVPKGSVYAFEPNLPIYAQFTDSIKASVIANIKAYNIGLGKEKKEEKLFINTENIGGSSLLAYKVNMENVTIQIEKGDDVLMREGVQKVDFIKIDVEGYEYEALLGLTQTIEAYKPKMLIEFTPIFYNKKSGNDGKGILDFLLKYGYRFQDLESHDTSKVYSTREEMMLWLSELNKDQTNVFCYI